MKPKEIKELLESLGVTDTQSVRHNHIKWRMIWKFIILANLPLHN